MKKSLKAVFGAGLVVLLSFSTVALADARTAKVRLVATINNGPAFQPVEWEVYRLDNQERIYTSNRHTFTLTPLPPGRYKAIAKRSGGKSRERDFYVMADTNNRVHIPVD